VPAWQARCVAELCAVVGARLEVAFIAGDLPSSESSGESAPSAAGLLRGRASMWELYDHAVSARSASARPTDLASSLDGVTRIEGSIGDPAATAAIRDRELAFVLSLSVSPPGDDVLSLCPRGVWCVSHGRGSVCARAPCFEELARGERVVHADLTCHTRADPTSSRDPRRRLLDTGVFPIFPHSYAKTLDAVRFGSAALPARACKRILIGADLDDGADARAIAETFADASGPAPDNWRMGAYLPKLAGHTALGYYGALLRREQWSVGLVDAPIEAFLRPDFVPVIRWLPTLDRNRYLADPFGTCGDDGRIVLFAEDYDYRERRGHISVMTGTASGPFGAPEPAIELPEHLSYPYLFTYRGETYCIPEANETREVRLFKAERYPRDWRMVAVLVHDFAAVDSTVFEHEGRFWLLCTNEDAGSWTALYAFHAPDLLGPWEPHAANPVKIDVRSSRPAGRPFVADGQLYRPAQDCSRTYGGAIALNRVVRLTPRAFVEEVVRVIEPDPRGPFPNGLHTISPVGRMTLVDGKRMIYAGDGLAAGLRSTVRGVLGALSRR
jgi:hypothetical protein